MILNIVVFVTIVVGVSADCYFNAECPYPLFSSKTPYDTIRGDIRDQPVPENCEAVSFWSIHRHGNRNPGNSVTAAVKVIAELKDDIISSHEAGRGQLCAQDIEEFRKWTWNETLELSASFLTGVGYEELYDLGKRIREKYPILLNDSSADYYFRPTNEQRTITSSIAFVHGLTDGTNLDLVIDAVREREDVIRPYENCDNYQENVKNGPAVDNEVASFASTNEYVAVQNAVQQRLGITYQLTTDDIYTLYEICRFYRSWTANKQSPWCAAFTNEDLLVLEYRDDVRHYHRNGYGSWVNVNLGGPPMKDLYENIEAATQGRGRKIVSYFTHDTMMEMIYCALGLYKDEAPLVGSIRNQSRLWRSSYMGAMAVNLMAVLYSCQESGSQAYRVQIFNNEKVTDLCPLSGCTWEQFQTKFQPFLSANLDFCSLDYPNPDVDSIDSVDNVTPAPTAGPVTAQPVADSAVMPQSLAWLFVIQILVCLWRS